MRRFFAVFAVAALFVSMQLPALHSGMAAKAEGTMLQNFDGYANTGEMNSGMYVAPDSLATGKLSLAANGVAASDKSLKIITHDAASAGSTADFRLQGFGTYDLTATTSLGIKFWVKSASVSTSTKVFVQLEGGGRASFDPSKSYYLEDSLGAVSKKSFVSGTRNEGHIQIPAGFEGWAYLPFASLYPLHINNLAAFYGIWICPELENSPNKMLFMDSIQFFDAIPQQTVFQDFDKYTNTNAMKVDMTVSTLANDKLELAASGPSASEKSLKIITHDAVNVGQAASLIMKNFGTWNLTDGSSLGLKIWAKAVNSTSTTKMYVQMIGSNYATFASGRAYFLQPVGGDTTQQQLVTGLVANVGYMEIPAGFEGWICLPYTSLYNGHLSYLTACTAIRFFPELANSPDRALYLDSIQVYKTAPTSTMLQNFDRYDTTDQMKTGMYIATASLAVGKLELATGGAMANGKSLKITTHDATNAGSTADFRLQAFGTYNLTTTTSQGLKLWVKSTSTSSSTKVFLQLEGSSRASFGVGKPYYLKSASGVITQQSLVSGTRAEGHIQIPAGFEGWVYLPYSSLYTGHINYLATFYGMWVCPELENFPDKALYMDGIQFYSAIPQADDAVSAIAAIGKVTPASSSAIAGARTAYNGLDAQYQDDVANYTSLTAAETAFETYCPTILGATIRTSGVQGLRFGTRFDTVAADGKGYSVVGYGSVLMAAEKWNILNGELIKDMDKSVSRGGTVLEAGQTMEYGVTLINIPKDNQISDVMCRSYVIYKNNATNQEYIVYNMTGSDGDDSKAYIRNIKEIAIATGITLNV